MKNYLVKYKIGSQLMSMTVTCGCGFGAAEFNAECNGAVNIQSITLL